MPCLLNDKLSLWAARSVEGFRRLAKRRNKLVLDPAAQGLAGLQVTQVLRGNVDHIVERGGQVEPARDVRRDEHVGRIPQRACCGQWLRVGDIDRGTGEMT